MTARPHYAGNFAALAQLATELHADRVQGYPAQVAAEKMTQAAARHGLRVMGQIAADWARTRAYTPPADREASQAEMIADLVQVHDRQLGRVRKLQRQLQQSTRDLIAAGSTAERVAQQDDEAFPAWAAAYDRLLRIQALLWWTRQRHDINWIVEFNHMARIRTPAQLAEAA